MFKKIEINDWKHINKIGIDFHPKLTIITGANGSGKSTVIRILARHFGWGLNEFGTPSRDENTGGFFYYARKLLPNWLANIGKTEQELGPQIGKLTYLSGQQAFLSVPAYQTSPQYQIQASNQQNLPGIFIPAHRPPFVASNIANISTRARTKQEAFSGAYSAIQNVYNGGGSSSGYHLKETLLNWLFHGYGNQMYQPDQKFRDLFESFQKKVKEVLPQSIGFQRFEPRQSELVLICDSGVYPLDACSGGISSLLELVWQIFTFEDNGKPFTVLIDEVENHLHPSMQRSILTTLIEAFPMAQFIVVTHSPFVVSSAKDSAVYAFQFGADSRVVSQKLELVDKAATASEILRQVLGVPLTIPIWAEDEISTILKKYELQDATPEVIRNISNELRNNKLDHLVATSGLVLRSVETLG